MVDDEPHVRQALGALLGMLGFAVVGEAANGAEAVDRTADLHPDVVVMDMRMPVMGGVEATQRIRERAPETGVVILTAYDDSSLLQAVLAAGASAHVLKGASPSLIRDAVAAAVRRSSGRGAE